MKAALFADLKESEPPSMARYARELHQALLALNNERWQFEQISCSHVDALTRLIPGKAGQIAAERAGRFLKYPIKATSIKADLFHILDSGHANLGLAMQKARTVITCHDLIALKAHQGKINIDVPLFHRLTDPLRIKALRQARHIIADSTNTKRDLMTELGIAEKNVTVVPLGVSSVFAPATPEEKQSIRHELRFKHGVTDEQTLVMLHVSSGAAYKNTPAVVNALALSANILQQHNRSIVLFRVGTPLSPSETGLAKSLGVDDKIIRVGFVPGDAALRTYYLAADVFVFPSLWEGFGWPALEALACGAAVVTSNVSSLPEVVEDAALQIAPTDHEALAKAICSILLEKELRERLERDSLIQAAKFSWARTAKETLEVYDLVLKQQQH